MEARDGKQRRSPHASSSASTLAHSSARSQAVATQSQRSSFLRPKDVCPGVRGPLHVSVGACECRSRELVKPAAGVFPFFLCPL